MTVCAYKTLCVQCCKKPVCEDWYPMYPGVTLKKYKAWKDRP